MEAEEAVPRPMKARARRDDPETSFRAATGTELRGDAYAGDVGLAVSEAAWPIQLPDGVHDAPQAPLRDGQGGAGAAPGRGRGGRNLRRRPRGGAEGAGGQALIGFVKINVEPGSTVKTDGWEGYSGLRRAGYRHIVVSDKDGGGPSLPRIHRVFSNLKSWLIGTHHGVSKQHLPAYLNEFVFRFNRRKTPLAAFQTVLGLAKERLGPTYSGLYGVAKKTGKWAHPNRPTYGTYGS